MKNILKDRGSVYCNEGAWEALSETIEKLQPSKIFILTDANTENYCLPVLQQKLALASPPEILSMPEGEEYKTITTCVGLWASLSAKGADRQSLLINLGGGVVTDLGGFLASTFKRGISFVNIPTSLLAMVDASVGGKNGVDLGVLKNQIGVINNPEVVIIDTQFLKTLPPSQTTSGYAEMLKHGLIRSETYWKKLNAFDVNDTNSTEELIWESVEIKNKVVTEDPSEQGLRKTLNYGHTLGHAIESFCMERDDRRSLLHGEAIAIGMILATFISSEVLDFPKEKLGEVSTTILEHFPKEEFSEKDIEAIIDLLIFDKKNRNGQVYFVLLNDFGEHQIDCKVANSLIFEAFDYYKNF